MTHVAGRNLFLIALIMSGDIHPHPGPALGEGISPCGLCELRCVWDVTQDGGGGAICCDDCSMWYHRDCLDMSRSEYVRLGKSSATWHCIRCKNCSVNSFTFHGYNVHTSNSFSVLQNLDDDSVFYADRLSVLSPASDFNPGTFSSPRLSTRTDGKTSCSSTNSDGKTKDQSFSNPNGKLRILTLNANSAKGKAAEISSICEYVKPDIIIMSETKLDKSVSSSEFLPERFQGHVIRKDRTIHGGGVLIAHRKGLVANPVSCIGIKSDCELVMSRVQMSQGQPPLYVGAYYRSQVDNSPNTSLDGLDSALEQVYDLVGNSKSTVVLAGDFNCPDIDWDSLSTRAGCKLVSVSDKLIRISSKFGLSQLQKDPTRLTSLLDLFFTNNDSLLSAIETVPGISTADEHVAIVTDLNLKADICKSVPHRVHQWKNVDWEKVKGETKAFADQFCVESHGKSVDDQWKSIEQHLNHILKIHVPSKLSKSRKDQPWLNRELKRRCRRKQRL